MGPESSDNTTDLVTVERRGAIALVAINNPKVNALSTAVLLGLSEVFQALQSELPGAVVVIGGPTAFSAGADINELSNPQTANGQLVAFRAAFDAIAAFPRATIAAIRGVAFGGGLELALSCDFRFVAADVRLAVPEVRLGIIPGAGGTQRLSRLVGPSHAKDMIFTGRQVRAESLRIGLANRVVDSETVIDEAIAFGEELAHGAVLAQSLGKQAVDRGLDMDLSDGLDLERSFFERLLVSNDAKTGLVAFLERRSDVEFTGT